MLLCVDALGKQLHDDDSMCDDMQDIDAVRTYIRSMISVALNGVDIVHTELLDEAISRICLGANDWLANYDVLAIAILLSSLPALVVGKALLPKIHNWARVLLRSVPSASGCGGRLIVSIRRMANHLLVSVLVLR